jgi:hypothetical protein
MNIKRLLTAPQLGIYVIRRMGRQKLAKLYFAIRVLTF